MPQPTKSRAREDLPVWATAMRVRRAELGKSQESVALDSGILNQTTVSELEGGRYDIANLTAGRLAGLARGLNWTLAEMESALGVDFGLSKYHQRELGSMIFALNANRSIKQASKPRQLPKSLIEAIQTYGATDPILTTEKWQQHLVGLPLEESKRPKTALDWYVLYRSLRNVGIAPEQEEE